MAESWLEIGHVFSVDAARRSVRIMPNPGCDHEFDDRDRLWMQIAHEVPVPMRVARVSEAGNFQRVDFTAGASRDMIARLRHALVLLPREKRRPRPGALPSLQDMLGMRVELANGKLLGSVFEVVETPAGGAIRMTLPDKRTAALPCVDAVIKKVDVDSGVITVTDPEPFMVTDDAAPDA
jgi:ribosomal 30S subunit maturation factor RimM